MRARSLLSVAATATLLLATPVAARAAGVTIDPDSPAGKEYALPLDAARSGGGGGAARSDPANGDDHRQLFGAGVENQRRSNAQSDAQRSTAAGTGSSSSGERQRKRKQPRDTDARTTSEPAGGSTRTGPAPATTNRPSEAALAAAPGGGGSGPVLAIVGGVLVAGLLVGVLLRWRGRGTTG